MQQHAWIDGAGARAHDETVERREPHTGGDGTSTLDGGDAGTVAEMGDDQARRNLAGDCRHPGHDGLIGESVKAVAANPPCLVLGWQGQTARFLRDRRVEGRVETGDLWE